MITDRTKECLSLFDPFVIARHVRPLKIIQQIVVHKTSLSQKGEDNPCPIHDSVLDVYALCETFRDNKLLGTGCWMPYSVLIRRDGTAEQCAPLKIRTAHARSWNVSSIGIALVGDFDQQPPFSAQWRSLVCVISSLAMLNGGLDIVGHTDLYAASGDPNKHCPGKYLNLRQVEIEVANSLPNNWQKLDAYEVVDRLLEYGWVLHQNT